MSPADLASENTDDRPARDGSAPARHRADRVASAAPLQTARGSRRRRRTADATQVDRVTRLPSRVHSQRWPRQSSREGATRPPRHRVRTPAELAPHPRSPTARDRLGRSEVRDQKADHGKSTEGSPARSTALIATPPDRVGQSKSEASNHHKLLPLEATPRVPRGAG